MDFLQSGMCPEVSDSERWGGTELEHPTDLQPVCSNNIDNRMSPPNIYNPMDAIGITHVTLPGSNVTGSAIINQLRHNVNNEVLTTIIPTTTGASVDPTTSNGHNSPAEISPNRHPQQKFIGIMIIWDIP